MHTKLHFIQHVPGSHDVPPAHPLGRHRPQPSRHVQTGQRRDLQESDRTEVGEGVQHRATRGHPGAHEQAEDRRHSGLELPQEVRRVSRGRRGKRGRGGVVG